MQALVGNTLGNIAEVHRALGHYEEALAANQEALVIKKAALGDKHVSGIPRPGNFSEFSNPPPISLWGAACG